MWIARLRWLCAAPVLAVMFAACGSHSTIQPNNHVPTVTAIAYQTSYVGQTFSLTPAGQDADGDVLTWSATGLPASASVNAQG